MPERAKDGSLLEGGYWNWNLSYLFNFRPFVKVKILPNSQLSRPSVRAVDQVAELVHGIRKPGGGVGHLAFLLGSLQPSFL